MIWGILTEHYTTTTNNNCHRQHSHCTSFGEAVEQPDSHTPPGDFKVAQPLHITLYAIYFCHLSYDSEIALINVYPQKSLETIKWIRDF